MSHDALSSQDAAPVLAAAEDLRTALTLWQTHDNTRPQPEVRRAANTAFSAINGMIRDLHAIHRRLLDEVHESDEAGAARVDALLAQYGRAVTR